MIIVKAINDKAKVEQIFETYQEAKVFAAQRDKEGYICVYENYPQFNSHEELSKHLYENLKLEQLNA